MADVLICVPRLCGLSIERCKKKDVEANLQLRKQTIVNPFSGMINYGYDHQ